MNIDKHWLLFTAVAAAVAAGAALMSRSRQRQHRTTHDLQHKEDVKAWENEGGNLAPIPVVSTLARALLSSDPPARYTSCSKHPRGQSMVRDLRTPHLNEKATS